MPLILYAPEILTEPKRISRAVSEVDVFPTLAGLAGIPYVNTTLGRDVLNPFPGMEDYAFIAGASSTSAMRGVISEKFLFRSDASEKGHLYELQSENPGENVLNKYPDIAEKMDKLSRSFLETTRYMLYFNKRYNVEDTKVGSKK